MQSMTHREYEARIAWLRAELGGGSKRAQAKPSSQDEAAAWAKAKWFGALGIKGDK